MSAATTSTPTSMTIAIPGQLLSGKWVIYIDQVPVRLTYREHELMLFLATARLKTRCGLTKPPRDTADKAALHALVRRLRRALGRQGKQIVLHGGRSCYYLSPGTEITIDSTILELEHHLPKAIADLRSVLIAS